MKDKEFSVTASSEDRNEIQSAYEYVRKTEEVWTIDIPPRKRFNFLKLRFEYTFKLVL